MTSSWSNPAQFDRLDEIRRDLEVVAGLWRGAAVVHLDDAGALAVDESPDGWRLRTSPATGPYDQQTHWLLGRDDSGPVFATVVGAVDGGRTIRDLDDRIPPTDLQLATMAAATAEWHKREPHCPQCGGATDVVAAGSARSCARCRRELFPRTDPAVIVAVRDADDRLLLGHQSSWPEGRFSLLAGFVEAGESLEQAVHREVYEEAGVRLSRVDYAGSQPWPFPRSVMLGFWASATTTDIVVDGTEIVEARWFGRAQLRQAVFAGEVGLPGTASIARRLITEWLSGDSSEPGSKS